MTWGLVAACGLLAALTLWPRLTVQRPAIAQRQDEITVAVSGAVQRPGSYTLAWGARVEDAVAAAGGLGADADEALVNLAAPLDDAQRVFVPQKRTETGKRRVSINSASADELQALPGIGPVMAGRIIAARPFQSVDELLKVRGIGPVTLEKLRPLVTL